MRRSGGFCLCLLALAASAAHAQSYPARPIRVLIPFSVGGGVRSVEDVRKGVAEWVSKPGPMIIDARISRAVISLPFRRVLYGKDE